MAELIPLDLVRGFSCQPNCSVAGGFCEMKNVDEFELFYNPAPLCTAL